MSNLDPYSSSSFGSVLRDSPGLLREWGYTQSIQFLLDGAEGSAFCSGTGSTGSTWSVLPVLAEGETLNIFGLQAVTANNGNNANNVMQFALEVTDSDGNNGVQRLVASATSKGPWFERFELPVKIQGPARVRILPVGAGIGAGSTAYNFVTIQYVRIDESSSIVS